MKIFIEGYKAIAEKRTIDIGGLTILSGANSSGKSSFMQPLLLIKQTLENDFDAGAMLLDGPNVRLTDSSQIISKVPGAQAKLTISLVDDTGEAAATYSLGAKDGVQVDNIFYKNEFFTHGVNFHVGLSNQEIREILKFKDRSKSKKNELRDTAIRLALLFVGNETHLNFVRNRCFLNLSSKISKINLLSLPSIEDSLGTLVKKLIHVPGLRGNPERSYKTASYGPHFPGSFEKYMASILHHWKTDETKHHLFSTLQQQLKQLGLATSLDTSQVNNTRLELQISRLSGATNSATDFVNIADVGFGVSQILPVLVALLTAEPKQMVYIEQPELHLHPRAQFKLAQVIAYAVAKRKVAVVIETHSAVLIRGVQILVAKRELDPTLVSLNWFAQDPQTGQCNITEAKLDQYGAFGDWPEDFDEVSLDVEKMYLDAVEEAIANEA